MAGVVDDVLKSVGESITIVRGGGNVSTYFYVTPKGRTSRTPYERDCMIPSDSGVVEGDLIQHLSDYYLVTSVFQDRRVGEFFSNRVRLYKCNSTITIKAYDNATKTFVTSKSGIPCLIVDGPASLASDRSVVVPGFSGGDQGNYLYAQTSAGITKSVMILDSAGRHLRVLDSINYYFASGLVEVGVKPEA